MDFPFNFIIIPGIIIATAVMGMRYVKRGRGENGQWYKNLHKPSWAPKGKLIGEIWTFLYIVTGLAILWYWNVPVFSWLHYVTAVVLLVNAYYNATWNKIFFVEHDLEKAHKNIRILIATTILAIILIAISSPIAAFLMLPYIIWLYIAMRISKEIVHLNKN